MEEKNFLLELGIESLERDLINTLEEFEHHIGSLKYAVNRLKKKLEKVIRRESDRSKVPDKMYFVLKHIQIINRILEALIDETVSITLMLTQE